MPLNPAPPVKPNVEPSVTIRWLSLPNTSTAPPRPASAPDNVNATVIKANAHAIASTAGSTAGASGGTDDVENVSPGYYKGMAVFIISTGGLMFEASISGQRFSYRPLAPAVDA